MGPLYELYCDKFLWSRDEELLSGMLQQNEEVKKSLEERFKSAEESETESDVREALLATAQHYTRIGDKVRL